MIRFAERFASVLLALSGTVLAASDPGKEYFARGGIDLFSSSHQDIAWMDTPHACMLFRVNQCIAPSLRLMAKDPNFSFVMENMLNLAEYLEEKPGDRALVEQLTGDGRLEWGATFNQPYEDLLSAEELVRETYFGRRWLKRLFPGADARVAFNPDVPGRTLQMPPFWRKPAFATWSSAGITKASIAGSPRMDPTCSSTPRAITRNR